MAARVPPPEVERARIREALMRRRADEEWELALRRLRDEAYISVRWLQIQRFQRHRQRPKHHERRRDASTPQTVWATFLHDPDGD